MKSYKICLMAGLLTTAWSMVALAQEQTNEVLMTWRAVGYTTNEKGELIATNLTEKMLIDKVAADNNIDPLDCEFVYRIEKRDTAVVWRTNGLFIADVYQMEYTYQDVTNDTGTVDWCESLLNDEYHTNAIGSTFGLEEKAYNREGYLIGYNYRGTFHCAFPESNVVFTGNFATGARVYEKDAGSE